MMMYKKFKMSYILSALCLFALLFCTAAASVHAAAGHPEKGSVTMTLENEGVPVTEAAFKLYHIADTAEENDRLVYRYTKEFAGCGAALDDLNASGLAEHLAGYAESKGLSGGREAADAKGRVCFESLSVGLYLLVQDGEIPGYYSVPPFLVSVPLKDGNTGTWIYEVDASPKMELLPKPGIPESRLKVKKVWRGDGGHHPDEIGVHLLKDGKIYETVVLDDRNHWEYEWNGLDSAARWTVCEAEVPKGYHVSYSSASSVTTITNTGEEYDEETLTVQKVWKGDDKKDRPSEITVELWDKDKNTLYDTVVLKEESGWSYTWTELPKGKEWAVKEKNPPEHYQVSYETNGNQITVKNTWTAEKLIQTGQLKWPVPVLAAAGLALFVFGWKLTFAKRKENET